MSEKPKAGRPKGQEPGTPVTTWLKVSDFDRLTQRAGQQRMTVSAFIRQLVTAPRHFPTGK